MRTVPVPTTAAAAVAPAVQAVIPAVAAVVPAAPAIMVLAAAPAVSAIPPVAAPAVPAIFPAAAVEPAVPATSAVASPAPPTPSGSSSPVTPTVLRRSGRPPRNLPPKLSPEALLDSGARSASPPTNHQHVLIQELTDINRAQREHHSLFLRESLVEFRHLVRHVVTDPEFRPQQQQASEVNDHARQLGKLLIYSFIY